MHISVYPEIHPHHDARGTFFPSYCYGTRVVIEHSPSEGFDNEKLGKLEKDLAVYVTDRLRDAIKGEDGE